jgi:hypothetical protein
MIGRVSKENAQQKFKKVPHCSRQVLKFHTQTQDWQGFVSDQNKT